MKALWSKIAGFARNYLIPNFLLGKEKAVAAFLVPLVIAQLARFAPSLNVDAPLWVQVVAALLVSISVHQTTNT